MKEKINALLGSVLVLYLFVFVGSYNDKIRRDEIIESHNKLVNYLHDVFQEQHLLDSTFVARFKSLDSLNNQQ